MFCFLRLIGHELVITPWLDQSIWLSDKAEILQVEGAIQAIIEFLKNLFAFKDYIKTSDKLKSLIR